MEVVARPVVPGVVAPQEDPVAQMVDPGVTMVDPGVTPVDPGVTTVDLVATPVDPGVVDHREGHLVDPGVHPAEIVLAQHLWIVATVDAE